MFPALVNGQLNLLDLLSAGGAAIVAGSDVHLRGCTPSLDEVIGLVQ